MKSQIARFMIKMFEGVRRVLALLKNISFDIFSQIFTRKYLPREDPNDEPISSECEEGECDVDQGEEIVHASFWFLKAQPMFWDLFEIPRCHVPS